MKHLISILIIISITFVLFGCGKSNGGGTWPKGDPAPKKNVCPFALVLK